MIDVNAYKELEAVVGKEYLTEDPAVCTSYAIQPFHRTEPGVWVNVPAAVILPACTEDVAAIVKICNKYKIKYKAHSTGFGAHAGPGQDGVLQVDLRRMNHLIDFDEKKRDSCGGTLYNISGNPAEGVAERTFTADEHGGSAYIHSGQHHVPPGRR